MPLITPILNIVPKQDRMTVAVLVLVAVAIVYLFRQVPAWSTGVGSDLPPGSTLDNGLQPGQGATGAVALDAGTALITM